MGLSSSNIAAPQLPTLRFSLNQILFFNRKGQHKARKYLVFLA